MFFRPNRGLIKAQSTYPRDGPGGFPTVPVDVRERTFLEEAFFWIAVANTFRSWSTGMGGLESFSWVTGIKLVALSEPSADQYRSF